MKGGGCRTYTYHVQEECDTWLSTTNRKKVSPKGSSGRKSRRGPIHRSIVRKPGVDTERRSSLEVYSKGLRVGVRCTTQTKITQFVGGSKVAKVETKTVAQECGVQCEVVTPEYNTGSSQSHSELASPGKGIPFTKTSPSGDQDTASTHTYSEEEEEDEEEETQDDGQRIDSQSSDTSPLAQQISPWEEAAVAGFYRARGLERLQAEEGEGSAVEVQGRGDSLSPSTGASGWQAGDRGRGLERLEMAEGERSAVEGDYRLGHQISPRRGASGWQAGDRGRELDDQLDAEDSPSPLYHSVTGGILSREFIEKQLFSQELALDEENCDRDLREGGQYRNTGAGSGEGDPVGNHAQSRRLNKRKRQDLDEENELSLSTKNSDSDLSNVLEVLDQDYRTTDKTKRVMEYLRSEDNFPALVRKIRPSRKPCKPVSSNGENLSTNRKPLPDYDLELTTQDLYGDGGHAKYRFNKKQRCEVDESGKMHNYRGTKKKKVPTATLR